MLAQYRLNPWFPARRRQIDPMDLRSKFANLIFCEPNHSTPVKLRLMEKKELRGQVSRIRKAAPRNTLGERGSEVNQVRCVPGNAVPV